MSSSGYLTTIPSPSMPTGGGGEAVFYENSTTVTANYTITTGQNAMSAGPITVNSGAVVTVGAGSTWTIV